MGAIIRLALRNLREHKSKTIIISLFLVFGVTIVILGNSFLESVNRGLEKDFRANYTGDFAISVIPEAGTTYDLFGVNTTNLSNGMPMLPPLPELEKIEQIVAETEGIRLRSKLISSQVMITPGNNGEVDLSAFMDNDDIGLMDYPISMMFAGETSTYWKVFPDLNLKEGDYPAPGSNEILIDTRVQRNYEKCFKEPLNIGDTVLVLGATADNIIREAKVCGIFTPANENSAMFQIVYCNPELARSFAKLTYASSFSQELPDSVDLSISSLSEDDMFGSFDDSDDLFGDIISDSDDLLASGTTDFNAILGDTTLRNDLNKTDDGAWNFVLGKFTSTRNENKILAQMNERFREENLNVQAMNWKQSAYSYSQTVKGIGFIFNLLIIILAIVVFIIIMNTMTVSVIERTSEIGTMRAIGADKSFVRGLFFAEAIMLTSVSSVAGIIIAFIVMGIFNACNITITNEIAKMILGGGLLHFSPTFAIILLTVAVTTLGGILSNLYPVTSALRISPLKALSKGE